MVDSGGTGRDDDKQVHTTDYSYSRFILLDLGWFQPPVCIFPPSQAARPCCIYKGRYEAKGEENCTKHSNRDPPNFLGLRACMIIGGDRNVGR